MDWQLTVTLRERQVTFATKSTESTEKKSKENSVFSTGTPFGPRARRGKTDCVRGRCVNSVVNLSGNPDGKIN